MLKKDSLPYLLFGAAILLAVWFANTENEDLKGNLAGGFIIFLGLSITLWGFQAVRRGRVLVKRRHVTKDEHPIIFWSVVVLFRFVNGRGAPAWRHLASFLQDPLLASAARP